MIDSLTIDHSKIVAQYIFSCIWGLMGENQFWLVQISKSDRPFAKGTVTFCVCLTKQHLFPLVSSNKKSGCYVANQSRKIHCAIIPLGYN